MTENSMEVLFINTQQEMRSAVLNSLGNKFKWAAYRTHEKQLRHAALIPKKVEGEHFGVIIYDIEKTDVDDPNICPSWLIQDIYMKADFPPLFVLAPDDRLDRVKDAFMKKAEGCCRNEKPIVGSILRNPAEWDAKNGKSPQIIEDWWSVWVERCKLKAISEEDRALGGKSAIQYSMTQQQTRNKIIGIYDEAADSSKYIKEFRKVWPREDVEYPEYWDYSYFKAGEKRDEVRKAFFDGARLILFFETSQLYSNELKKEEYRPILQAIDRREVLLLRIKLDEVLSIPMEYKAIEPLVTECLRNKCISSLTLKVRNNEWNKLAKMVKDHF